MKKYWKVRYDSDIKNKLKYLKLPDYYIDILLDEFSSSMEYLKTSKFINISYDSTFDYDNKCGWFECNTESEKFMKEKGYKYVGEVNLRKEKILKISEKSKA